MQSTGNSLKLNSARFFVRNLATKLLNKAKKQTDSFVEIYTASYPFGQGTVILKLSQPVTWINLSVACSLNDLSPVLK